MDKLMSGVGSFAAGVVLTLWVYSALEERFMDQIAYSCLRGEIVAVDGTPVRFRGKIYRCTFEEIKE